MARAINSSRAQKICAQKNVAKLTVRLHERAQGVSLDLDQLARFCRANSREAPASRKHIHFAGKHSATTDSKDFFFLIRDAKELKLSGHNHEHLRRLLIQFDQCFTGRHRPDAPVGEHATLLFRSKNRKRFVRR
jgi:hypothetical protein